MQALPAQSLHRSLDAEGMAGLGDRGPVHMRPDTPGLRGETRPPQLSQLAQSPASGAPGCSGSGDVTQAPVTETSGAEPWHYLSSSSFSFRCFVYIGIKLISYVVFL